MASVTYIPILMLLEPSGTFRSRLMGQHLSDAPRDIATLTVDLAGIHHGDTDLRAPSVHQV